MSDRNQPLGEDASPDATPEECYCCPGSQLETVCIVELEPSCAEILYELTRLGQLLCFARNRNCSIGIAACMPEVSAHCCTVSGVTYDMNFHLNTDAWKHVYAVHERNACNGRFVGFEFFDEHHNAIFRTALTPDSEVQDFDAITRQYFRRHVPIEEIAGWSRMAEMRPLGHASHKPICDGFTQLDPWSGPLMNAVEEDCSVEMGFPGHLPLARAILVEAMEEKTELLLTVSGAFGRFSMPFTPQILEDAQRGWLFVGGEERMLRLDPKAVASYWIGKHDTGQESYSYIEALDCYGDLIIRLTSYCAESFQYWQSLARTMK